MKLKLKLVEQFSKDKDIALDYDDIEVQVSRGIDYWDGPQWDDIKISWTLYVSEAEVAEILKDYFIEDLSEEEYDQMLSTAQNSDAVFDAYVENHFDELFSKYYDSLLEIFRSRAEEEATVDYDSGAPDYDDYDD